MTYPTELIAKANFEISIFDRLSVETSIELINEVLFLRDQFSLIGAENTKLHEQIKLQNKALAKQFAELDSALLEVKTLNFVLEELDHRPDC